MYISLQLLTALSVRTWCNVDQVRLSVQVLTYNRGRPQSRRGLCQHFYNVVTVSTKHIVHKNTAAPEYVGGGKDGDWVLPIVKLKGISINLEREFVSTHRGVVLKSCTETERFFFFFFLNMHIVTLTHIWSWSLLTCRQKPLDLQQQLSLKLVRPAFGTV